MSVARVIRGPAALRLIAAICVVVLVFFIYWKQDDVDFTMTIAARSTIHGHGERKTTTDTIQSSRIAKLKDFCKSNIANSKEFPPRNRFVVNEKYKLLYCQVFKTGSTTTLTILHNLEHGERRSTHDMRSKLDELPFKRLSDYTDEEARLRLETYAKLLIVRNPLERLASAWQDKFIYAPSEFWRKKYQSMTDTISKNSSNKQVTPEGTGQRYPTVPFTAFIKAVGTNKTEWQDPHWDLISDLCAPCLINYDFIVHTDTIAEDYPLFFLKAGIVGREDLLPKTRQQRADTMFWNLYKQIPIEDLWRIKGKFQADYDMFGFSFHNDIIRLLGTDSF
ncbi:carbohydrate sulfotransferase 10-like [Branchiostoma floridae x Branchiostoma belcheri]